MSLKNLLGYLIFTAFVGVASAESDCRPHNAADTQVVDRGPVKTVIGPLANFNPCHSSVRLDTPSFFAKKLGEKPPLVIIAHGGGGLGGYERDFAKLMNQQGFATLIYDAFEMNGLQPRSELLVYNMSNGGRQRMIFKATLGAFRWAITRNDIDSSRVFVQGLSNGGAVAVNMAALTDAPQIKGVIAEGAPTTGIGFPNSLTAPLLMIYGLADNYGGERAEDFLHTRAPICSWNDHYPEAPEGFTLQCSRTSNREQIGPSPKAWYEQMLAKGQPVRLELIDGGGHGMLFLDFSSSSRQLSRGRAFYASHGASPEARRKLQALILDFMLSRLN